MPVILELTDDAGVVFERVEFSDEEWHRITTDAAIAGCSPEVLVKVRLMDAAMNATPPVGRPEPAPEPAARHLTLVPMPTDED